MTYFQKPRCGEARTIWFDPYCPFKQFSTVFFKDWNSWMKFLFYFLLAHRLKTLNKEQYNLTHVVLVVISQIFIKSTHSFATLHFPIFLADCDSGTIQFDAFFHSNKSIKFSIKYIKLQFSTCLANSDQEIQYSLTLPLLLFQGFFLSFH